MELWSVEQAIYVGHIYERILSQIFNKLEYVELKKSSEREKMTPRDFCLWLQGVFDGMPDDCYLASVSNLISKKFKEVDLKAPGSVSYSDEDNIRDKNDS